MEVAERCKLSVSDLGQSTAVDSGHDSLVLSQGRHRSLFNMNYNLGIVIWKALPHLYVVLYFITRCVLGSRHGTVLGVGDFKAYAISPWFWLPLFVLIIVAIVKTTRQSPH